jgi:predicted aminopeptidase
LFPVISTTAIMRRDEAGPGLRGRGASGRAVSCLTAALAAMTSIAGCAGSSYLAQSIGGQFDLVRRARPVEAVLADPQTRPALRVALARAVKIRDFATRELLLPDNGSYRRFADIERPYVVWNVFAAPEFSLQLREWCFPVAGCVGYRGYFSKAGADEFAERMKSEGLEVYVGGVPAYSTLGWFDDPLLSTFIHFPDGELARLMFHELAHQVAYARDDSTFNESFAVAVEREGVRRYLALAAPELGAAYARVRSRREDFTRLVATSRERLAAVYAALLTDVEKRAGKQHILDELRRDYDDLKSRQWEGYTGYDAWFAGETNNAKLASMAVYAVRVPAFEALLRCSGGDLAAFYARVKQLAAMPKRERDAALDAAGADGRQAASE